jgi:hypothetical protein
MTPCAGDPRHDDPDRPCDARGQWSGKVAHPSARDQTETTACDQRARGSGNTAAAVRDPAARSSAVDGFGSPARDSSEEGYTCLESASSRWSIRRISLRVLGTQQVPEPTIQALHMRIRQVNFDRGGPNYRLR